MIPRVLTLLVVGFLLLAGPTEAQFTQPGYNTIREEGGSPLVRRREIDCIGAGITCADHAATGRTRITVTPGAGTGTTGLIGCSSCGGVISGDVGTLYMAAGTCLDAQEVDVEQRVANNITLEDMACITSADPGSGKTITVTGRTGTCGSLSPSGTFVCTLTGGSGRPNCNTGANTLAVVGTECWSLQVVSTGGSFSTDVSVTCTMERTS